MLSSFIMITVALLLGLNTSLVAQESSGVHMANGIKTGEVTATSAIIWTRLTENTERNIDGIPFPKNANRKLETYASADLPKMEGWVGGAPGEVRISYWPSSLEAQKKITPWLAVDVNKDFTYQFRLTDLQPGSRYQLIVEGRPIGSTQPNCRINGGFSTAPQSDVVAPVSFTVVTGQDYPRRDTPDGHKIYPAMQGMDLDFFVHTGDIEYYDKPAPFADTLELARLKWNRVYSLPHQRSFHNVTASYFMKDDHDTLKNDCWPGQAYGDLTWEQGLALFREQVPMGENSYRTIRWGKDLQIWLVEGRDFRSPNNMPDGPGKTIWGEVQKKWFFETVEKSDATFRILISPTPIVGPDRGAKNDNHANKGFTHEGEELRSFIGKQKNMFVVCGDRHWQYVSVDPVSGVKEFSCGPTSNVHAGGFSEKNKSPMHRYLKVKGGYLNISIQRSGNKPVAVFKHFDVNGKLLNEEIIATTETVRRP